MDNKITLIRTGFFAYTWSSIWGMCLMMIPFYLNYKYIGGNNFIDLLIFIICTGCAFSYMQKDSKKVKRFKTMQELKDWIIENENND